MNANGHPVEGWPFLQVIERMEKVTSNRRLYLNELGYQNTVNIYSFNKKSVSFHEKLGFVKEGQLRSMIYSNGKFHDEFFME
jgi:hypothetical protein